MHAYFCTRFPGMRTFRKMLRPAAVFLGLSLLTSLSASAQNGRTNSSKAQAALHIEVKVVPVILPPHHRREHRDEDAISYNFATQPSKLSATEELRPFFQDASGKENLVRITTVVAE